MGSPSRNVQYHPPRLSEDRLNLPPASQSIFAYTLLREIGNAPPQHYLAPLRDGGKSQATPTGFFQREQGTRMPKPLAYDSTMAPDSSATPRSRTATLRCSGLSKAFRNDSRSSFERRTP